MDGSGYSEEKNRPGKFWHGLLFALIGWLVDVGLTNLVYSLGMYQDSLGWQNFAVFTGLSLVFGIVLAVVWLPVGIAAGIKSKKEGFKEASLLVILTLLGAPLLVGCGFGVLAVLTRG